MRYLTVTLLLLMASCGGRSPSDAMTVQPPLPPLAAWKPSLRLADTALADGAPAVALRISDELLTEDPRDTGALIRRGNALIALRRFNEAAASYNTAIQLEPRNSRAVIGLGRARLAQDPAAAEALFTQAAMLDPTDAVALSDLGVARDMQGHHAAAQDAYRKALGAAPTSVAVQVNLGLSMALSGNAADAVRMLQPLAGSNAAPRVRENLALALALSGNRKGAASVLNQDMPPEQVRRALNGFEALRQ